MDDSFIRCPCTKCMNTKFMHPEKVKLHLYRKGFLPGYRRLSDAEAERVFGHRASSVLRNLLENARRKNRRPIWMSTTNWAGLTTYWRTPEFRKISVVNKANRRGGREGDAAPTHTGGSLSFTQHRENMTKEKGVRPTIAELFRHTHTRKKDGGAYITRKAEDVMDRYENEMMERSQSASNENQPPPDPTQVYLELVDKTKNKVFGLGSESRLYVPGRRSLRGSGSSSNEIQRQVEHLQQRNTSLEQLVLQQQKILDDLQRTVRQLSRSAGSGTNDDGVENEQENRDDQDENDNEHLD